MPLNRYIHRVSQLTATSLLLLAFLFQIYNKAIYTHSHLLDDGTIITHAHPYTKTDNSGPVTNHSHTQNQLLLFSIAELLFFFYALITIPFYRILFTDSVEKPVLFSLRLNDCHLKNKSPPLLLTTL